jgi:hypothetical protein
MEIDRVIRKMGLSFPTKNKSQSLKKIQDKQISFPFANNDDIAQ